MLLTGSSHKLTLANQWYRQSGKIRRLLRKLSVRDSQCNQLHETSSSPRDILMATSIDCFQLKMISTTNSFAGKKPSYRIPQLERSKAQLMMNHEDSNAAIFPENRAAGCKYATVINKIVYPPTTVVRQCVASERVVS